jgi:hypothetical protein
MRSFSFVTALALAVAPLGVGCMSSDHSDHDVGTLDIPLQQAGGGGSIYHLAASFDITGPAGTQTVDGNTFDPSVSVTLPPGITRIKLDDGWTLTKSTDGGVSFQPVSALLATQNPQTIRVLADFAQTVEFDFIVRDASGTVNVTFGVTEHPRKLEGGIVVESATNTYAPYASLPGSMDFAIYFKAAPVDHQTLPDGTKQNVISSTQVVVEYFNDKPGVLTSQASEFTGGFLGYHVAAKPDGTQEASGELDSVFGDIALKFGPRTLEAPAPLGADGFPTDQFFYESQMPFTQTLTEDDGTGNVVTSELKGQLRLRFVP